MWTTSIMGDQYVTTALIAGLVCDNAVDDGTLDKTSMQALINALGSSVVVGEFIRLLSLAVSELRVRTTDYRGILAAGADAGRSSSDVQRAEFLILTYIRDRVFNGRVATPIPFPLGTDGEISGFITAVRNELREFISNLAMPGKGSAWTQFIGILAPAGMIKYTASVAGTTVSDLNGATGTSSAAYSVFADYAAFAGYAYNNIVGLDKADWGRELTPREAADYVAGTGVSINTKAKFDTAYLVTSSVNRDVITNWTSMTGGAPSTQAIGEAILGDASKYAALQASVVSLLTMEAVYAGYCGSGDITAKITNLAKYYPANKGLLVEYYTSPSTVKTSTSAGNLYYDLSQVPTAPNTNFETVTYTLLSGASSTIPASAKSHIKALAHFSLYNSDATTASKLANYLTLQGIVAPDVGTSPTSYDQWRYFLSGYSNAYLSPKVTKNLNVIYDAMVILTKGLTTSVKSADDIILDWFTISPLTAADYGTSAASRAKAAIANTMRELFCLYDDSANITIIKSLVRLNSAGDVGNDNVIKPTIWSTNAGVIEPSVIDSANQSAYIRDMLKGNINAQMTYFMVQLDQAKVNTTAKLVALSMAFSMEDILAARSNYTDANGIVTATVLDRSPIGRETSPLFESPSGAAVAFTASDGTVESKFSAIIANLLSGTPDAATSVSILADMTNTFFGTLPGKFRDLFKPTSTSIAAFNKLVVYMLNRGLTNNLVGISSTASLLVALSNWLSSEADADNGKLESSGEVADLTGELTPMQYINIKRVVSVLVQAVAAGGIAPGELQLFTQFFAGQQQLVLVHYAAIRSNANPTNLRLSQSEFNALVANARMTPDQVLSAVYLKYDVTSDKVGPVSRYVYVRRDENGLPTFV